MSDSDDEDIANARRPGGGDSYMRRIDSSASSLALGSSASDASIAATSNGVAGFDDDENWRPDAVDTQASTSAAPVNEDPGKALSIALGLLDMGGGGGDAAANPQTGGTEGGGVVDGGADSKPSSAASL